MKPDKDGNRIIEVLQHRIKYWYEEDQEMPDYEEEHVKEMIIEGYNQGQLVDETDEGMNTGWWSISRS